MRSLSLKALPHHLIPKKLLTLLAGMLADVKIVMVKNFLIEQFVKAYQVNMSEAQESDFREFKNFNDFFIRQLKKELRPFALADIVSPVDGSVSEIGDIQQGKLLQAKGHFYTVAELVHQSAAELQNFNAGSFATLYLSPKDYHRIHMPIAGEIISATYIPGKLFSVKPSSVEAVPKLFAQNSRLVLTFTTLAGPMVMVLVGATIVGAIGTAWAGDIPRSKKITPLDLTKLPTNLFQQGDEIGYFKLGSTVILMFAEPVKWHADLKAKSSIRLGQALAMIESLVDHPKN